MFLPLTLFPRPSVIASVVVTASIGSGLALGVLMGVAIITVATVARS